MDHDDALSLAFEEKTVEIVACDFNPNQICSCTHLNDKSDTKHFILRVRDRSLQACSIFLYLVTWVANGEMVQGVASGTLCPGGIGYDKPAFLTWFDYNFMLLSFLVVVPFIWFYRKWTMRFYFTTVWAGCMGVKRAVLGCAAISMTLTAVNIFFVLGLECVSVATLNAVYQLQTGFTVLLSVLVMGDRFVASEALGISACFVGVAIIVVPSLVDDVEKDYSEEWRKSCPSASAELLGIGASLGSAVVWAVYQVGWRFLYEGRFPDAPTGSSVDGLIDNLMTLGVVGACNLVLGLPILFMLHWIEFERFELPPSTHSGILVVNALVEFVFDVSCAFAIYMTSPTMTSITAPLTIPISLIADDFLYGSPFVEAGGIWVMLGGAILLVGIGIMELKPRLCEATPCQVYDEEEDLPFESEFIKREYLSMEIELSDHEHDN